MINDQKERRSFLVSSSSLLLLLLGSTGAVTAVPPVGAYEERPVGGESRSAVTAAMNLQSIETNNRLEKEGVKLETQAEQIATLSAELSSYSYEPTTTSKTGNRNSSSPNQKKTTTTDSKK